MDEGPGLRPGSCLANQAREKRLGCLYHVFCTELDPISLASGLQDELGHPLSLHLGQPARDPIEKLLLGHGRVERIESCSAYKEIGDGRGPSALQRCESRLVVHSHPLPNSK
jgi:hypothetical protein